ncbi:hypothetical protein NTH31_002011 [Vibrio mimicus]|uniref:hypothetical protein n=1 Tax=Vibrio mimicus TaxID=674 RepID=UPI0018EEDEED|nr:hypothetical protein [Vibrio mimicus]
MDSRPIGRTYLNWQFSQQADKLGDILLTVSVNLCPVIAEILNLTRSAANPFIMMLNVHKHQSN